MHFQGQARLPASREQRGHISATRSKPRRESAPATVAASFTGFVGIANKSAGSPQWFEIEVLVRNAAVDKGLLRISGRL